MFDLPISLLQLFSFFFLVAVNFLAGYIIAQIAYGIYIKTDIQNKYFKFHEAQKYGIYC